MDPAERRYITRNLSYLRETLIDLNPVLDILIEEDIFDLNQRSKILETNQNQRFDEFINILVSCPRRETYRVFRQALQRSQCYTDIVRRLDETSSEHVTEPEMAQDVGASSGGLNQYSFSINSTQAAADAPHNHLFSRILQEFQEVKAQFERQNAETQNLRDTVNAGFERQNAETKNLTLTVHNMREKLDTSLAVIESLNCKYEEIKTKYSKLQEDYIHLQKVQAEMRKTDTEREGRLKEYAIRCKDLEDELSELKGVISLKQNSDTNLSNRPLIADNKPELGDKECSLIGDLMEERIYLQSEVKSMSENCETLLNNICELQKNCDKLSVELRKCQLQQPKQPCTCQAEREEEEVEISTKETEQIKEPIQCKATKKPLHPKSFHM